MFCFTSAGTIAFPPTVGGWNLNPMKCDLKIWLDRVITWTLGCGTKPKPKVRPHQCRHIYISRDKMNRKKQWDKRIESESFQKARAASWSLETESENSPTLLVWLRLKRYPWPKSVPTSLNMLQRSRCRRWNYFDPATDLAGIWVWDGTDHLPPVFRQISIAAQLTAAMH